MKQGFAAHVAGSAPSLPSGWADGYPTDGDPLAALPPTEPGAYWFHMIGESLQRVIVEAGLTPDPADLNLLKNAIAAISFPVASVAEQVAGSVIDKAVTPGRFKYSPMAIKKVIKIPGAGSDGAVTPIINLGGAARAERKGSGFYRVLFSTTGSADDMASGAYAVLGLTTASDAPTSVGSFGGSITPVQANIRLVSVLAQDATGFIVKCEGSAGGGVADPVDMTFIVIGVLP